MKVIIAAFLVFSMNVRATDLLEYDNGSQYSDNDNVLSAKIAWAQDNLVKVLGEELKCTNVELTYKITGRPTMSYDGYFDSTLTGHCKANISFFYYDFKAGNYGDRPFAPTELEVAWEVNGKRTQRNFQTRQRF